MVSIHLFLSLERSVREYMKVPAMFRGGDNEQQKLAS